MEKNKIVSTIEDKNKRLDIFVCEKMPELTRSYVKTLIENGNILLNGKMVKSGEKLRENDEIIIEQITPKTLDLSPENIDINIIYEDDDFAVINKPQGLVVHPANGNESGTLVNALLYHLKNLSTINGVVRPGIVHRIDKDTSGLLLIAKNDKAHLNLSKQIETKNCHRHYLALCVGNFKDDYGTITTHIDRSKKDRKQMAVCPDTEGKIAITHYIVKERFGDYTLVEFVLDTGRTHQIRVHSKFIHHPIVGDKTYGVKDKFKLDGQLLHAYKIELNRPSDNKRVEFTCPLPDYFEDVLDKLRKKVAKS